jgi:hypothetical protein
VDERPIAEAWRRKSRGHFRTLRQSVPLCGSGGSNQGEQSAYQKAPKELDHVKSLPELGPHSRYTMDHGSTDPIALTLDDSRL